ncbi:HAD domain-containing protein [Falsiroseomonas sp. HC035]|uniref:HAD domain-containing protein n=1 Tax=Falsiroseomonas sp. HC035 TaxID=3390999 RepID=UPI003D323E01
MSSSAMWTAGCTELQLQRCLLCVPMTTAAPCCFYLVASWCGLIGRCWKCSAGLMGRGQAMPAEGVRPRVVFIDIDGVLLTRAGWLHPRNAEARAAMAEGTWDGRQRGMSLVSFDQHAIWLLNRLARLADAHIVVSSMWRRSFGAEQTVAKLVAEGLDATLLHADPACRGLASSTPAEDILDWLRWHRLRPMPDRPEELPDEEQSEERRLLRAYSADYWDEGWDWIVLDDRRQSDRWVRIDADDGLTVSCYRVALRAFGAVDQDFGVFAVDGGLWREVVAAHHGDPVEAAAWLEGRGAVLDRPLDLLQGWPSRRAARALLGQVGGSEAAAEAEAVAAFRARLAQDRPAQEPEPEPEPRGAGCDADF